ncbi:MAG TPA: hypothetical protein VLB12_11890 [Gemmatimonadales bacterium]|nr:hypothetical protein [Gemmatimonadales bacterium]
MFPHFEPEPHAIGTGWSILLCTAAFGLGVIAAGDGGYNKLLRPSDSSPTRSCAHPRNLPAAAAGVGLLPDTLEAGLCDRVPGVATEPIATPASRSRPE